MTKLLSEALQKVAQLPRERQDDIAHVLMAMVSGDAKPYRLTHAQLAELELAIEEVDAGNYASDKDIDRLLYQPWA